jgi:hypothetical protein
MTPQQVSAFCALDAAGRSLLEAAFEKLGLSAASKLDSSSVPRALVGRLRSNPLRSFQVWGISPTLLMRSRMLGVRASSVRTSGEQWSSVARSFAPAPRFHLLSP